MNTLRLGVDVGGTKIAVGLVAFDDREPGRDAGEFRLLSRRRLPTSEAADGVVLLDRIAALAEEVCAEAGQSPQELDGVGIALPGPFDPRTQRPLAAPSLPGLVDLPILEFFADRWNRTHAGWVRADNDANAAALAEARCGAGRGGRVVCYFTVSTGIGGGVVVNGHLFRGATGQAGEFGHVKLREDGPPCSCGDRGCLEALASGTAIARRAREAAAREGGTLRSLLDQDPALITAERVAEAVRAGDPPARRIWGATMADLGAGIATVINLFNPDVVVIGGGVSRSADLLLPAVRKVVAERAMPMLARACRIECAALGDDVGVVGAALLAGSPTDLTALS